MVDVGGRRLHVHCTGSGTPTVILEAGASSFALDFSLVQPEIARMTRVCSYDRAGYGWSDRRQDIDTPEAIIQDLDSVIRVTGERPPFVMVGHSRGGILVRLFTRRHPEQVLGAVLIDPGHEDELFTMYKGEGVTIASLTSEQLAETIPTGDAPVAKRPAQTGAPFNSLPTELYELRVALEQRQVDSMPDTVPGSVVASFIKGEWAALSELRRVGLSEEHPFDARPLIVLTRGQGARPSMVAAHERLARSSTNGRHRVVPGSYHEIHLSQPTVVIEAVREVLEAVRR